MKRHTLCNSSALLLTIVIATVNINCAQRPDPSTSDCCFDGPRDTSLAANLMMYTPRPSSTEVEVDTVVELSFDRDSVGYSTYASFIQRVNNQVVIRSEAGSPIPYEADVSHLNELVLKPLNPLEFNTRYNVIISGDGDGMNNTFSFTTKSKIFKGPSIRGILYATDRDRIDIYFHQAITFKESSDLCLQTASEAYCIGQTQVEDDPNQQFYIDIPPGTKLMPNDNLRITETVLFDGTPYQLQPNPVIESTQDDEFVYISINSLDECFAGVLCKGDVF